MAAQARVSLLTAEVATSGVPEARLLNLSAEVALTGYVDTQISRLFTEVATGNAPDPRMSGLSAEVAVSPAIEGRISHLSTEVATGNLPDPRLTLLFAEVATSATTFETLTLTGCTPPVGWVTGGDAVVLTGTGFVAGAAVTFGDTAATSVVVLNATTLTCVTPAHTAGSVTVVVTLPDTRSTSLANGFVYMVEAPSYQCPDRFPAQEPLS